MLLLLRNSVSWLFVVDSTLSAYGQVEVIIPGSQDISGQEIWVLLCLRMFCRKHKLRLMIELKTRIETSLECVCFVGV